MRTAPTWALEALVGLPSLADRVWMKATRTAANNGIRQGDSLNPLLFNIIMDEAIKKVRLDRGYRMGNDEVTIICHADDAMICAENEEDLQRLLNIFNRTGNQFNMTISAQKTKSMTTSKEPFRCKLEVDGQDEVRQQVAKANKVAGCLNDVIWRNKHLKKHTKVRVYKTTIRLIMTYTAETKSDTAQTRRLLETTEMKILRRISGKTLLYRERNENIRQSCRVDAVNDWCSKEKNSGMTISIQVERRPMKEQTIGLL
ncbi:uncharacterized protein LOC132696257 [Cylas formicarius]|uniref:uncharacterized protein LOC132696257 n=1 Tax=Cylas formicarius TaxID=197179 RepID=UPI002958B428|nr:uncharacterized protein LOC132696257 [Cylas formicarius]